MKRGFGYISSLKFSISKEFTNRSGRKLLLFKIMLLKNINIIYNSFNQVFLINLQCFDFVYDETNYHKFLFIF